MITTDEILSTLPTLPGEDILKIGLMVESLKATLKIVNTEDDDWLLPCIVEEIKSRGLSYTIPDYFKIKRAGDHGGYARKSEMIRKTLTAAFISIDVRSKVLDLYGLGCICAKALADLLDPIYTLSLDIMLRHVDELPQALEASYPGYLNSGLLYLLLKLRNEWRD